MIFLKDVKVRATVWKVEDKGKFVKASLGTSEKKQDGNWENSFWFATFVGKSKDRAAKLNPKDKIEITNFKLTNISKGEGTDKKTYFNFTILDFENSDSGTTKNIPEDKDELPF